MNYCFDKFELDSIRRILLREGEIVTLNPKAFDLLSVLVEKHGTVLSKDELLETVWEDSFVEENNLTVHISALRKIFGEKKGEHKFIVTIPGKGYKFVAEVKNIGEENSSFKNDQPPPAQIRNFTESEPIIGRAEEIAGIKKQLLQKDKCLVTLTGAGGSGKTRLAKTIAAELKDEFSDGVFFIELAALNNSEIVASAIAKTLGIEESGSKSLIESLISFLRERRTLLVLDNFEQILSAAPLLRKILDATESLKILVTSRAALHLDNEREIVIAPLALPPFEKNLSAENLSEYAAIELFVRRAESVRQNFVLSDENASDISEICRKLDGLPLAIELAAARVKLLSPESILERLENSLNLLTSGAKDLPERQHTMRGAVQWSYELLDGDEKILFRHLAVFAGGFTVEAAEAISENYEFDKSEIQTLDLLGSLTENSLLNVNEQNDGGVRLQMLEVVREFAAECLEENGEFELLKQNHARFFLALAEEAEPHLSGEKSAEWLEKLAIEHDNFRAALSWFLKNDGEIAARIAATLRDFWLTHSHYSEGLDWSKAALQNTENILSATRIKLLLSNGVFLKKKGEFEAAQKVCEQALTESIETNDLPQTVKAYHGLSAIAVLQKDYVSAKSYMEKSLALNRELNDEYITASALCSLGDLEMSVGNYSAARPLLEESLLLTKKLGGERLLSIIHFNLGIIDYIDNEADAAGFNFAESLRISKQMDNKMLISCAFEGFAALAVKNGNAEQSAKLAGAAENLRESIGYKLEPADELFHEKYLQTTRAVLDEKSFAAAYATGQNLDWNEAVALAESSIHETYQQDTEIIVETHKIERVLIEEKIEEFENEPKLINEISVSSNEKTSRSWLKKHLAAITVTVLSVLALIGVYVWQRGQTAENPIRFQQISINRLTTNGNIAYAALSPDGKFFAYWAGRPATLWLGHTSGGEPIELRPAGDVNYHILRFSSDSNSLYYVVSSKEYPTGALFRLPVFGNVPEKLRENIKTRITFAPDMKHFAYVKNDRENAASSLIIADTDGASEHEISSRPLKFQFELPSPAWSADGKTIAVGAKSEESDGKNSDVFAVSAVEGQITRMTKQNFRAVSSSAWLADGSGLVFTASEQPQLDKQIWYVSYPQGEARQINPDLNNYGSALGISADGETILAVQTEYSSNIWIAPADDFANAEQLTFSALGAKYGRLGIEWTPDNKLIYTAVTGKSQTLWTMDIDGGNQKKLTPDGFIDLDPSVTDDGRVIVFGSNRSGTFEIWRVNADGGDLRQLTFSGGSDMPSVSPDGNWVVYILTRDGLNTVCRIPLEGGAPVKLSDRAASSVRVSPDSRFVACDYEDNGIIKLAVLPIEGGAPVKLFDLSPTANLRYALRWMPDGKTITYRDWENGYWQQSVDGGTAQKFIGLPEEKFFASDWSPDSKKFAFTRILEVRDVILLRNLK